MNKFIQDKNNIKKLNKLLPEYVKILKDKYETDSSVLLEDILCEAAIAGAMDSGLVDKSYTYITTKQKLLEKENNGQTNI